jgi:hypothetical protein
MIEKSLYTCTDRERMKRKNNCIDMHPLVTDAKAAEVR